jgi:Na+/H+ antiporter NhaC
MNPSIYAIYSTFVSFIVLMIYYYTMKPDFVKEVDKNSADQTPQFSLRLSVVYGLLFSSLIGLVVLGILSILKNKKKLDSDESGSEGSDVSEGSESSISIREESDNE